jgi:hypothetical protein
VGRRAADDRTAGYAARLGLDEDSLPVIAEMLNHRGVAPDSKTPTPGKKRTQSRQAAVARMAVRACWIAETARSRARGNEPPAVRTSMAHSFYPARTTGGKLLTLVCEAATKTNLPSRIGAVKRRRREKARGEVTGGITTVTACPLAAVGKSDLIGKVEGR